MEEDYRKRLRSSDSCSSKASASSCYLDGSLALHQPTSEQVIRHHERAQKAVAASHQHHHLSVTHLPGSMKVTALPKRKLGGYTLRKNAIEYIYVYLLDMQLEEHWNDEKFGAVPLIMNALNIPQGTRKGVVKILHDIVRRRCTNEQLAERRGRPPLITEMSEDAYLVYLMSEHGHGVGTITNCLNLRRKLRGGPIVCQSAVQRFIQTSRIMKKTRRTTEKTGKTDANSPWAIARFNLCSQYKIQLGAEEYILENRSPEISFSDFISTERLPNGDPFVFLDAIVFWDEKHKECVIGCNSKYETRLCRNVYDGEITPPEYGGVFADVKPRKKVKFSKEARACFGVAMRTKRDSFTGKMEAGSEQGIKCKPFSYTGRMVYGLARYNKEVDDEIQRAQNLNRPYSYAKKYGSEECGRAKAKAVVDKKCCCITEIMDFIVSESNKVYENTVFKDTFMIFHDGLTQWWTAESQQYLHDVHNMRDRQMRAYGDTNKASRYYSNKVAGDSPELCPLDNYLFSDLERSINFHVALSSFIDNNEDDRCFHLGTPAQVESTMFRCWEIEPTSERIIQDIKSYIQNVQSVINANGTIVKNEGLRRGRRAERHQGDPNLRERSQRRKHEPELLDCHPSLIPILHGLMAEPKLMRHLEHRNAILNEYEVDEAAPEDKYERDRHDSSESADEFDEAVTDYSDNEVVVSDSEEEDSKEGDAGGGGEEEKS
jgi:hypothetical protein